MHTQKIKLHTPSRLGPETLSGRSTHSLTWLSAGASPLDVLRKGIFIFLLAVLFGVVYPGIAAYFAGEF